MHREQVVVAGDHRQPPACWRMCFAAGRPVCRTSSGPEKRAFFIRCDRDPEGRPPVHPQPVPRIPACRGQAVETSETIIRQLVKLLTVAAYIEQGDVYRGLRAFSPTSGRRAGVLRRTSRGRRPVHGLTSIRSAERFDAEATVLIEERHASHEEEEQPRTPGPGRPRPQTARNSGPNSSRPGRKRPGRPPSPAR